jgi:hypothetical protein
MGTIHTCQMSNRRLAGSQQMLEKPGSKLLEKL